MTEETRVVVPVGSSEGCGTQELGASKPGGAGASALSGDGYARRSHAPEGVQPDVPDQRRRHVGECRVGGGVGAGGGVLMRIDAAHVLLRRVLGQMLDVFGYNARRCE